MRLTKSPLTASRSRHSANAPCSSVTLHPQVPDRAVPSSPWHTNTRLAACPHASSPSWRRSAHGSPPPNPNRELADFAGDAVADAWDKADVGARKRIIRLLGMRITIQPIGSGNGATFDPESVQIEWSAEEGDACGTAAAAT